MAAHDVDSDRQKFRTLAVELWDYVGKNASKVSRRTVALQRIVRSWDELGLARELLAPLLNDHDDRVRYAAAAEGLPRGLEEASIPVLEAIASEPFGFMGLIAKGRLTRWRDDHE